MLQEELSKYVGEYDCFKLDCDICNVNDWVQKFNWVGIFDNMKKLCLLLICMMICLLFEYLGLVVDCVDFVQFFYLVGFGIVGFLVLQDLFVFCEQYFNVSIVMVFENFCDYFYLVILGKMFM